MTPEELMKPRYKVVIKYPHYPFDGDVLLVNEKGELIHETEGYPQSVYKILEEDIKGNPCFRLMEWWEEREKYFWSDGKPSTPLFVSNIAKTVFGTAWGIDLSDGSFALEVNGEKTDANLSNYIPATREEYDNYINRKH